MVPKGPVTLDDDMNIVLLIKNKDTQSIKVTVDNGENSTTKTYGLYWIDFGDRVKERIQNGKVFGKIGYAISKDVRPGKGTGKLLSESISAI